VAEALRLDFDCPAAVFGPYSACGWPGSPRFVCRLPLEALIAGGDSNPRRGCARLGPAAFLSLALAPLVFTHNGVAPGRPVAVARLSPTMESFALAKVQRQPRSRNWKVGKLETSRHRADKILVIWRDLIALQLPSEDLSNNLAVQLGRATEDLNRRWFERNSGHVVCDVHAPCKTCVCSIGNDKILL
jgi:hypothetical protein